MVLPSSGPITMGQINDELGRPVTQSINLDDPEVRELAEVPSGTISMSDFYGKTGETGKGGTKYLPGDGYTYHVFNSPGPFRWNAPSATQLQYILIGGGGGGSGNGGGGGGGAYLAFTPTTLPKGDYDMVVGSGGAGGTAGNPGSNGGTTSFASSTFYMQNAPGGGAGGNFTGFPGGCGGGSRGPDTARGDGSVGFPGGGKSSPGGSSSASGKSAGSGGGGMGSAGRTGGEAPTTEDRTGGAGGRGVTFASGWSLPAPVLTPGQPGFRVCGGGGGGATGNRSQATGGSSQSWDGGGRGAASTRNGGNANSRGGGGGGGSGTSTGGVGSIGLVTIRYVDPDTGGDTPAPPGGDPQAVLQSWAATNGFSMVTAACSGTVWGDPYSSVTNDSNAAKASYMSIRSSDFSAVINSNNQVAYKTTSIGTQSSYSSVTRNSCTSNTYGSFQGVQFEVAYYNPSTNKYVRKNTGSGFSDFTP